MPGYHDDKRDAKEESRPGDPVIAREMDLMDFGDQHTDGFDDVPLPRHEPEKYLSYMQQYMGSKELFVLASKDSSILTPPWILSRTAIQHIRPQPEY